MAPRHRRPRRDKTEETETDLLLMQEQFGEMPEIGRSRRGLDPSDAAELGIIIPTVQND